MPVAAAGAMVLVSRHSGIITTGTDKVVARKRLKAPVESKDRLAAPLHSSLGAVKRQFVGLCPARCLGPYRTAGRGYRVGRADQRPPGGRAADRGPCASDWAKLLRDREKPCPTNARLSRSLCLSLHDSLSPL